MSLGKELLQRRSELIEAERKLNENHNREVKSQWELIKHAIQNTAITKDTKYINLGYFPDMFKENVMRLHKEDLIVFRNKNKCIRLYLSEKDYKSDIQELLYGDVNSDKKSDFKINNNKQVEEDKNVETVKTKCKKNDFADLMNSLTRVVDWM